MGAVVEIAGVRDGGELPTSRGGFTTALRRSPVVSIGAKERYAPGQDAWPLVVVSCHLAI
jgi:hypothetical protein